ncbi:unnamed protein product [Paramecium octaurelia]|uniref:Uncharacterized protein n=1 Tax=Paramecium octaurelia TaxID=43137 RepID=A0A8S1YH01_PAROT|nr:unnamed protein product [Paramecium octaurelia]
MNQALVIIRNETNESSKNCAEILFSNRKNKQLIKLSCTIKGYSNTSAIISSKPSKLKYSHYIKESQIKEVYNRVKNLIQQLDEQGTKLETKSNCQIKTIRSIYLLNTNQLIQSAKQEAYKQILKLIIRISIACCNSKFKLKLDELFAQSIQIQFKIEEQLQSNNQSTNVQDIAPINYSPLLSQISQIQQTKKQSEFTVTMEDYLLPSVQHKVLHQFKYSNEQNLINHDNQKINLEISPIPVFHQSVITKTGQLYLFGGTTIDNNYPNNKSNGIYFFDKNSLVNVGNLLISRSSHGCCSIGDYIYSISGLEQGQTLEKNCERYNYILRRSQKIQDCLFPSILVVVQISIINLYINLEIFMKNSR